MRSLPRRVITAAKPAYAAVRASTFGGLLVAARFSLRERDLAGLLHHEVL